MSLNDPSEVVSASVPKKIKEAINQAVEKSLAISESDYIRRALIERLKKDKLLA